MQFHAGQQLRDQFGRDRVMRCGDIDFWDVPPGRGLGVYERAVIRHQQQAGGVMIEPAHRLHIAPGELFRQQSQHAGMMTGFSGAFEAGGFVQRDIDMFAVSPLSPNILNTSPAVSIGSPAVGNGLSGDADFSVRDQLTAPLARTEPLRLQDAVQSHFAHARTLAEAFAEC